MSKKALLTKIRDCISDRTSVLTKAELGVIDRELELFDSLVSHSLEINELAVLIAGVCKPIYEDTEKGIRRSHEVSGLGCLSSCLSSSPIVNAFWEFGLLGPSGTDRNLIVGRGHIAPAFYALRYSKGCFPLSFLLSTHRAVPAVVHKDWGFKNTMRHSLGEGIAMSIGRSLLESPKGNAAHNYCFSGDGELNEGICFEAIRIAYENDIKKYTLIVDDNESGIEKLKKPLNIKYLEAFFDKVHIIDNPEKRLLRELENCTRRGLREAIVCKTKKGTHSYKMPGLPSNTSTCSAISDILVRLSRKYCSHVITPDMAGRFGLVEKLGYINTGLSEQASVAMTIGLPTDEVKLILTDDKFLLNSIDCIQSAMSSVNNLQIIAARRNDLCFSYCTASGYA